MSDFSSDSSDTSSSDDELEELFLQNYVRQFFFFEITISQHDTEFREHFRVTKDMANIIADEFTTSDYYYYAGCYGKLSAFQQICTFLWFVAHQTASFRDVADCFNITISSLYRVVRRIMYFKQCILSNKSASIITWPNAAEKLHIEQYFRIDRPNSDPDSYINRKGFYSIQVSKGLNIKKIY